MWWGWGREEHQLCQMERTGEPGPGDRPRPQLSPLDFSLLAENVCQQSKLSGLPGKLTRTKEIHLQQRLSCKICDYQAAQAVTLKLHVQSVHQKIKIVCKECNKEMSKTSLGRHRKLHHTTDLLNYQCGICTFQTRRKDSLYRHSLKVHRKKVKDIHPSV